MKKFSFIFKATLITLLSSCVSSVAKKADDIPMGSVSLKPIAYDTKVLGNGLTVVFKKRTDLPLISGTLYLPTGTSRGNCGVPGLAGLSVSHMREGGTSSYTPDQLDQMLDDNAAKIEVSQLEDITTIGFSSLSEDFNKIFNAFSEVVLKPRFDKQRLDLTLSLLSEEISRRKDSAETMASLAFSYVMYGEGSVYYDPVTKGTISKITQDKIKEYYNSLVQPEGAYLIVTGNIEKDELFSKVENAFVNWKSSKKGCLNYATSPMSMVSNIKLKEEKKPTVYLINSEFAQAAIVLGHKAPKINELNVYKMALYNRVFGSGSFDSVLFKEIRDKRGLAYGVSGGISPTKNRGTFTVSLATKSASAGEAITGIREVLTNISENGFSKESIEGAIRSSLQAFVFKFEDPSFAVSRPALIKLSGFPEDYDQKYQAELKSLSNDSLKDFANQYIDKDKIIAVVVGQVTANQLKEHFKNQELKICELSFNEVPALKLCY